MSAGLICPNCSTATMFHRPPVSACPQCQQPFPNALRRSAEANLARQHASRPLLLTIGMCLSGIWALAWIIGLGFAAFNVGSFSIKGQTLSGPEFLRQSGLLLGIQAALCVAICYGLLRDRAWTRVLMLGFWAIVDVILIAEAIKNPQSDSDLATAIVWSIAYLGFATWYLYGNRSAPIDYYKALEAEEAASATDLRRLPHVNEIVVRRPRLAAVGATSPRTDAPSRG